jgi:hypothetical protein
MKKSIIIVVWFCILIIGCQNQNKEYSNVTIEQVTQNIKWSENYTNIKEMLENKYGLKFDREIEQKVNKNNGKVYKFLGGKINGIKTQSWAVTFNNDSLDFIIVIIDSETKEQNANTFQELRNNINTLSYDKYSKEDNTWILSNPDKSKCGIQLISNEKAIVITFSSNKYINKYSYL